MLLIDRQRQRNGTRASFDRCGGRQRLVDAVEARKDALPPLTPPLLFMLLLFSFSRPSSSHSPPSPPSIYASSARKRRRLFRCLEVFRVDVHVRWKKLLMSFIAMTKTSHAINIIYHIISDILLYRRRRTSTMNQAVGVEKRTVFMYKKKLNLSCWSNQSNQFKMPDRRKRLKVEISAKCSFDLILVLLLLISDLLLLAHF